MFFSLLYTIFIVYNRRFGLQNYTNLLNYANFSQKIMNYELRIKNYFVPLHPKTTKYIIILYLYD